MGEAIIVFIFISWLLVTLLIYWFKHNVTIKDKPKKKDKLDEFMDWMEESSH
jgi:hypothetical protein